MLTVGVTEARKRLSSLLDRAASGEEIILTKNGMPIARLIRISAPKRALGGLTGRAVVPPEFDRPLPDCVIEAFER